MEVSLVRILDVALNKREPVAITRNLEFAD